MGCGGSKATSEKTKVALTDEHRQIIGSTANRILGNSVQFHIVVAKLAPLGTHTNATAMMNDGRDIRQYFPKNGLPAELAGVVEGNTNNSVLSMVNNMKVQCQLDCKAALEAQFKQNNFEDSEKARYEKLVGSEASKAMDQMVHQYISDVINGNAAVDVPRREQRPAGAEGSPSGEGGSQRQPAHAPARSVSPAANNAAAPAATAAPVTVVLPAGNWVPCDNSPFYWSDEEKLFYHPETTQFYDPETDKWYDPEKDEWYAEDEA